MVGKWTGHCVPHRRSEGRAEAGSLGRYALEARGWDINNQVQKKALASTDI